MSSSWVLLWLGTKKTDFCINDQTDGRSLYTKPYLYFDHWTLPVALKTFQFIPSSKESLDNNWKGELRPVKAASHWNKILRLQIGVSRFAFPNRQLLTECRHTRRLLSRRNRRFWKLEHRWMLYLRSVGNGSCIFMLYTKKRKGRRPVLSLKLVFTVEAKTCKHESAEPWHYCKIKTNP